MTRAIERAVNGSTLRGPAARASVNASDVEGGGGGSGGSGGGGGDQGRILFYHKPTLANMPAGDMPDAVPVYLGCPRGGMALGMPLNGTWQGGEQQVRAFCFFIVVVSYGGGGGGVGFDFCGSGGFGCVVGGGVVVGVCGVGAVVVQY